MKTVFEKINNIYEDLFRNINEGIGGVNTSIWAIFILGSPFTWLLIKFFIIGTLIFMGLWLVLVLLLSATVLSLDLGLLVAMKVFLVDKYDLPNEFLFIVLVPVIYHLYWIFKRIDASFEE